MNNIFHDHPSMLFKKQNHANKSILVTCCSLRINTTFLGSTKVILLNGLKSVSCVSQNESLIMIGQALHLCWYQTFQTDLCCPSFKTAVTLTVYVNLKEVYSPETPYSFTYNLDPTDSIVCLQCIRKVFKPLDFYKCSSITAFF